ncbi:MAG: LptF/LptG family permease, partial [Rhodothermales bacterium]|nr:LptF/LptG family permease [Rhodothermales bacterium]
LQVFADRQQLSSRIDADRIEWKADINKWRIRNGVRRTFDPNGSESRSSFATLDTTLNVFPRDFARTERDVESMSIPIAADYVDALKRSGADNLGRTLVNYYSKFSYPFANFILVLLGVPLASVRRRGGQAIQIGLGLLFAFTYLAVMKVIEPIVYS